MKTFLFALSVPAIFMIALAFEWFCNGVKDPDLNPGVNRKADQVQDKIHPERIDAPQKQQASKVKAQNNPGEMLADQKAPPSRPSSPGSRLPSFLQGPELPSSLEEPELPTSPTAAPPTTPRPRPPVPRRPPTPIPRPPIMNR